MELSKQRKVGLVPLCNLHPSMANFVPCDEIVQRVYWCIQKIWHLLNFEWMNGKLPTHIVLFKFFNREYLINFNVQCVPLKFSTDFMLQRCYQLITSMVSCFNLFFFYGLEPKSAPYWVKHTEPPIKTPLSLFIVIFLEIQALVMSFYLNDQTKVLMMAELHVGM